MEFRCLYMLQNTSTIEKKKKKTKQICQGETETYILALFKHIQAYYTMFVTVLPVCG